MILPQFCVSYNIGRFVLGCGVSHALEYLSCDTSVLAQRISWSTIFRQNREIASDGSAFDTATCLLTQHIASCLQKNSAASALAKQSERPLPWWIMRQSSSNILPILNPRFSVLMVFLNNLVLRQALSKPSRSKKCVLYVVVFLLDLPVHITSCLPLLLHTVRLV